MGKTLTTCHYVIQTGFFSMETDMVIYREKWDSLLLDLYTTGIIVDKIKPGPSMKLHAIQNGLMAIKMVNYLAMN